MNFKDWGKSRGRAVAYDWLARNLSRHKKREARYTGFSFSGPNKLSTYMVLSQALI